MSIPSAAVTVAAEHLGDLDGAKVLVVGAGQMGKGLASTLRSRGVGEIWIANRSPERAIALATRFAGEAIPLHEIADALVDVDVLMTSTASSEVLIERSTIEMVMACRDGRPLLIVDVALPRDVDPGVHELNDVTLLDLDDLKDYAQRSAERRRAEIGKVREILAAEIDRYRVERAARGVAPLVDCVARSRRRRAPHRTRTLRSQAHRSRCRYPRGDRRVDAGHREQAAPRTDGAREGRGGHPAWRLLRGRAGARCSISLLTESHEAGGARATWPERPSERI